MRLLLLFCFFPFVHCCYFLSHTRILCNFVKPLLVCVSVNLHDPYFKAAGYISAFSCLCCKLLHELESNDRNKHFAQRKWAHILLTSYSHVHYCHFNEGKILQVSLLHHWTDNTCLEKDGPNLGHKEVGGLLRKEIQYFPCRFLSTTAC